MSNTNEMNFVKVFENSLKITPRTLSIKTLLSERNLRRINYKPYYQRNYVWDKVKQTFFIESVILGTEIPPLILFKSGAQIEIIDGRQRFETLKRFIENDFKLTRRGLLSLPALANENFNSLKEELKEIFWESNIRIYEFEVIININSEIEDRIKKEIFRRYNTGITPLTSIEVDSAKYDNDALSEMLEKEIKRNQVFQQGIKKYVFPNETDSDPSLIGKMVDFLRKSFILSKFPISRYATGTRREEILGILYDTTVNNLDDLDKEKEIFINQIESIIKVYESLVKNGLLINKHIFESILWAVRILEQEGKYIYVNDHVELIFQHYKKNIHKYSDENSFFYKNIIERFLDTSELFENICSFSFDLYIKRNDFSKSLNELSQTDSDADDIIKTLESLRINKPSPVSKPVEEIISDVITNKYLIRPSYQRQEKITVLKASSIIESILLGVYLPPIFVFKRKDNIKEVIDGQQRLLSIIGFLGRQYRNEEDKLTYSINNSYKLKGLNILENLNGINYNSLSDTDKDKILDFVIDEIIIEESLNPDFEPTDLFIRLNQKPYPIKNNSFEMWNSTIDREVIEKIKGVTQRYSTWFYVKENSIDSGSADRMENEELITILSYVIQSIEKDKTYETSLGLFKRSDRLTCRIKNKSAISKFLNSLSDSINEKNSFLNSLERTEELIIRFGNLFSKTDHPSKEMITTFFNVKEGKTFVRSYQDFYITWLILNSRKLDESNNINEVETKSLIQTMLKKLRNVNKEEVNSEYFQSFIDELNTQTNIK
jgi:hypothetical protein